MEYDWTPASLCFHRAQKLGKNQRVVKQTRRKLVELSSAIREKWVSPIQHSVSNGESGVNGQRIIGNAECLVNHVDIGRNVATILCRKTSFSDEVNCCERGIGCRVSIVCQPVWRGILLWISRGIDLLKSNHEWCTTIGCHISPWRGLNSHSRFDDRCGGSRCVGCATSTDVSRERDSLCATCLRKEGECRSNREETTRYHLCLCL